MSEAQQDSQPAQLQAIPGYKKPYPPRKSRKAPAVKTAVIAKRAQGQNITSIANDLGITRNTTRSIIEESDIDRQLESGQLQSLSLIPAALRVMHDRLAKGSENAAIKTLEATIWPLQSKTSKQQDPGLVLAIQNLMGNVTVGSAAQLAQPIENKAFEPVSASSTGTIAAPDNSAIDAQVIENTGNGG